MSMNIRGDHSHISGVRHGTPLYIAPEIISNGKASKSADVYSFGVILWELYHGSSAWQHLMLQGDDSLLNTGAACDHPISRNLALARQLGVQGTPTLIWADGTRTEGFVGRVVMEERLAETASSTTLQSTTEPQP